MTNQILLWTIQEKALYTDLKSVNLRVIGSSEFEYDVGIILEQT